MAEKSMLIISCKADPHVDYMINKFNQAGMGHLVIRLNTEDAVTNMNVSFEGSRATIYLKDSGRHLCTDDIGCVWYRRPEPPVPANYYLPDARKFVQAQIMTLLNGLYYLTSDSALWINPRPTAAISSNKVKQLQIAQQLGFTVPKTLITNDIQDAHGFLTKHEEVCVKSLDSSSPAAQGITYPFHTAKLTDDEKATYLSLVTHCPTLFQEFIQKAYDLRVAVFGRHVYGVEIHSQDRPESSQDFRLVAPTLLTHRVHDIPADLSKRIAEFMKYFELNFSALDFAVTAEGKYYFLENNPNGQWLWLENRTGIPISGGLMAFICPHLG